MKSYCLSRLWIIFFVAQTAGAAVLYDGSLGTTPSDQGWLYVSQPFAGSQTTVVATNQSVRFDSTTRMTDRAGFFSNVPPLGAHPEMPVLDRNEGFIIEFQLQVRNEVHSSVNRGGFSLIVLAKDLKGVELTFWQNEIWAQGDQPLFTHAESKVFDTTSKPNPYLLTVSGDTYELSANGERLLSGPLRDYSSAGQPYSIPNFLFLGDNTSSAAASVDLHKVSIEAGQTASGASILSPALSDQGFAATLSCTIGKQYQVEVSTDLVQWTKLTNFTANASQVTITDSAATNLVWRFYRASQVPSNSSSAKAR